MRINFHYFPFLFLPSHESCLPRLKTQPAEVDKTPRESNVLSLFLLTHEPLYSMLHLSSCHSATQGDNSFHSTRNCSYSVSNKAQTCATYICILLTKASSRCSTSYSYLLTFSWHSTSHYSSVFCDADYILMLNSVIEYNHESLYLTTAGPGWYRHCYIFSHHLSFYFSFLYRRMPFHTTIPKRIQTMWVQYGLLPPPTHTRLPALNPKSHPLNFLPLPPCPATLPHPFPSRCWCTPPRLPLPPVIGPWAVCVR